MIEVKNLTKYYGKGESRFKVLDNINLKIAQGDFAVILGASGSGKSTLLNVLSGLEKADSGEVCLDGKDICSMSESERTKFRRDNVGFIFQQYYLLPNMNVDKNVRMGADLASNSDYRKIISAVGLDDKVKNIPENFRAESNSEWQLPERLLKSLPCCSLMSRQVRLMKKQADRCLM